MTSNFIFIFCSGFTFAVGAINFAIGILKPKDRSYLFFGILSFFASLFLLSQVYTTLNPSLTGVINFISIFLAVVFYTMFIWFIGEYTGYKKSLVQITISICAGIVFFLYLLANKEVISWELWEFIAHATIISISIFGIRAGIKGNKIIKKLWNKIYLLLMILLLVITVIVGFQTVYNISIIYDPEGFISPLDFFPVFFSIIVGAKMSHDVIRSYHLDKELDVKDQIWSSFMDKINLLVVKLTPEGKIEYVNSYFNAFTGYSLPEVLGKDWSNLMPDEEEGIDTKSAFLQMIVGKEIPAYQSFIYTKHGERKSLQWTHLLLKNHTGQISGILNIGTNVTELNTSLAEIKHLKNMLEKENLLLREGIKEEDFSGEIIGGSDSLKYAIKRAIQVSTTDSTVLLEGETGVGKELFANLIHRKSKRRHKTFIKVNCSAIPKELIESEFFGHEKGSFTGAIKSRQGRFELADNGTIFLDEVGEIPYELQAKLLRVLQSGEFERVGSEVTQKVEVRIIAATNQDLAMGSQNGIFREDLFYRLNVYPITIPPLRQRKEDVPILVRYFVDKIGKKMGKNIKDISKADLSILKNYDWPGNVRELENVIERAIINSSGNSLKIEDGQLNYSINKIPVNEKSRNPNLFESQKSHIIKVLEACDWKINGEKGAAQKLGIPPSTLRSKMKKLNIQRPDHNV